MDMLDILEAREQRAFRQQQLLRRFGKPLVCFTLNIPGPEKNHPLADRAFRMGCRSLKAALGEFPLLHEETRDTAAGPEGFFVFDADPQALKALVQTIEETSPVGRVYDMDVLTQAGKLSRETPRKCLLCHRDAAVCGRSRTHSARELFDETLRLLRDGITQQIARTAVTALLCELYATPKPGLVDQNNSGSHGDMDLFTFLRSAAALWPYFHRCAAIGLEHTDPAQAFALLRQAGLEAEQTMLRATGGVNTHKGAIFSMGILCAAAGMTDNWQDPDALGEQCAALASGLVRQDLGTLREGSTTGERVFLQFGITGARGQAEAGFPAARKVGLPVLEEGLAQGLSLNDALCAALLHILAVTQDTNLIKRGGRVALMQLQAALQTMLRLRPYPDRETLENLDAMFIKRRLSPGGSADMLAAACFFYLIKQV